MGLMASGWLAGLNINTKQFVGQLAHFHKTPLRNGAFAIRQVQAGRETGDQERRRSHRNAVTAHEFPRAVSERIWPCADGLVPKIAAKIVGEGSYRRVAFRRILLHRLGHDGVEISSEHTTQLVSRRDDIGWPP